MSETAALRETLNEGLRGVITFGQPVGNRPPSDRLRETFGDGGDPYAVPVTHHPGDDTGWGDRSTSPSYGEQGRQLAMPSPWSVPGARLRSLGHAPPEVDRSERSWRSAMEQTKANNYEAADMSARQAGPSLSGPQFDQQSLPGLGTGPEQMALFRTRNISANDVPTTTRGMYHTSGDAADWVASKAHESVDLYQHEPPSNLFEYGERSGWGDSPSGFNSDVSPGTRDHVNAIAQDPDDPASKALFNGTQFGDKRVRDNPVRYDEMIHDDDGSNYAIFTPDRTQVSGFDYDQNYEGDRVTISGAGTGEQFRGNRFGMRGAVDFASQKNDEGYFVHGNSFTNDGQAAFGDRGAMTEGEVDELIYDAEDMAESEHDEMVLAEANSEWEGGGRQEWRDEFEGPSEDWASNEGQARYDFIENYRYENSDLEYARSTAREDVVSNLRAGQRELLNNVSALFGEGQRRASFIKDAVQERIVDKTSGKKVGD